MKLFNASLIAAVANAGVGQRVVEMVQENRYFYKSKSWRKNV